MLYSSHICCFSKTYFYNIRINSNKKAANKVSSLFAYKRYLRGSLSKLVQNLDKEGFWYGRRFSTHRPLFYFLIYSANALPASSNSAIVASSGDPQAITEATTIAPALLARSIQSSIQAPVPQA